MKEIIFAIACITCILGVGVIANRLNRKLFSYRKTTLRSAAIALSAILLGLTIGFSFVPTTLIPSNQYFRIVIAVFLNLALGAIELLVIKLLRNRGLEGYVLNGAPFPFVSLGIACSLVLRA